MADMTYSVSEESPDGYSKRTIAAYGFNEIIYPYYWLLYCWGDINLADHHMKKVFWKIYKEENPEEVKSQ